MKIDEILRRLQEQQPDVSNPDELTDRIMDSLPDLPTEQPKPARRVRLYIVSAIAAAASVLLLLTLPSLVGERPAASLPSHVGEEPVASLPSLVGEGPEVGSVTSSLSTKKGRDVALGRGAKLQTPPPTPPLDGRGVAALPNSRQGVPTSVETVTDLRQGVPTSVEAVADSRQGEPTSVEAVADSRQGVPTSVEAVSDFQQGVPTSVEAVQIEYAQQTHLVQQAEPLTEVLTERDIPITRPENYKYTPEEIALMKKQAREAYLKWVELELEIAKYNQEQTANNFRDL